MPDTTPHHHFTVEHNDETVCVKITSYTPGWAGSRWEPPEPEDYDFDAFLVDGTPVYVDDPKWAGLEDAVIDGFERSKAEAADDI